MCHPLRSVLPVTRLRFLVPQEPTHFPSGRPEGSPAFLAVPFGVTAVLQPAAPHKHILPAVPETRWPRPQAPAPFCAEPGWATLPGLSNPLLGANLGHHLGTGSGVRVTGDRQAWRLGLGLSGFTLRPRFLGGSMVAREARTCSPDLSLTTVGP